jgi:outer membrane protein
MTSKSYWLVALANLTLLLVFLCYFFFIKAERIAYVDSNKLINGYQGMIDARQVYQKKASVWQANVDTLAKEVQLKIANYEKESLRMSQKEKDLSRELIRTKQKQLEDYQQALNGQAQQEDAKMTTEVVSQMNTFIKQYGEAHGYTIILATADGNIVYAQEAINITDEVLEGLNKQYKGQ